jgi:hypothetical protein
VVSSSSCKMWLFEPMKGFDVGVTPQELRGRLAWLAEMMQDLNLESGAGGLLTPQVPSEESLDALHLRRSLTTF